MFLRGTEKIFRMVVPRETANGQGAASREAKLRARAFRGGKA